MGQDDRLLFGREVDPANNSNMLSHIIAHDSEEKQSGMAEVIVTSRLLDCVRIGVKWY